MTHNPMTVYEHPGNVFQCSHCKGMVFRSTQQMAHLETGAIACTSCVIDAATLSHGSWRDALISKFRIRVADNDHGITPGIWAMTRRIMPLY